jgi:hypothetical protein
VEDEAVTLADVADIIMVEFSRSMGGLEKASPYIEKAYRSAGLNLYHPTREQIEKAIENFVDIEKELFDEATAEKNRKERLELLGKVKG